MSDKKKRNQFTFVESEETKGLVQEIDKLAKADGRKRNNWVGWVLTQIVNESKSNGAT